METTPCNAIANARRPVFDSPSFSGIIRPPMSQKTKTELEILLTTYDTEKKPETAHKLIELLRSSLTSTLKEKSILEADIRKLELFLASNA
jgi:hypothetical protein